MKTDSKCINNSRCDLHMTQTLYYHVPDYEVIDEPLTSVTELMESVSSSPVKAENWFILVSYNDIICYQVNI